MTAEELIARLALIVRDGGQYRVTARESTDLEFKGDIALATYRKSLKTIAAFANKSGGHIVFRVSDNPRLPVGLVANPLDEGSSLNNSLRQSLRYRQHIF